MGLFNSKASKGTSGNSGNASGGGWTLTGTSSGNDHRKVKTTRTEWKAPRTGDLAFRSSKRPKQ